MFPDMQKVLCLMLNITRKILKMYSVTDKLLLQAAPQSNTVVHYLFHTSPQPYDLGNVNILPTVTQIVKVLGLAYIPKCIPFIHSI